jgi:hypothetical protein
VALRDDQIFGLIAMLALLLWLGRRYFPARLGRGMEMAAFTLVGVGIVAALVLWARG